MHWFWVIDPLALCFLTHSRRCFSFRPVNGYEGRDANFLLHSLPDKGISENVVSHSAYHLFFLFLFGKEQIQCSVNNSNR